MFRVVSLLQASSTRISRQQDGSFVKTLKPGDRQSVMHFDGLPLTRGAVVATPFADAVFADIQTREEYRCSCKLEGNKVKNARPCSWLRLFCTSQKFLFVKLKSGSSCCSIITAAQMVNFSINNGRNVLKVKCKSKRFKRTNTNVNKSDKSQFKTNDTKY
jgi:hypothetical protein